jgi:hypothetical protein
MPFDFPITPQGTLGELWRAVLRLLPQMERVVIRNFTVGTVETPIAHGQKSAPKTAHPLPQADARVWQTKAPDTKCVYFAASASVVCDVEIVP